MSRFPDLSRHFMVVNERKGEVFSLVGLPFYRVFFFPVEIQEDFGGKQCMKSEMNLEILSLTKVATNVQHNVYERLGPCGTNFSSKFTFKIHIKFYLNSVVRSCSVLLSQTSPESYLFYFLGCDFPVATYFQTEEMHFYSSSLSFLNINVVSCSCPYSFSTDILQHLVSWS